MLPLYDENRVSNKLPIITGLLIVINTLVFFYTSSNPDYFISLFGFSPSRLSDGLFYTIITTTFLHASFWHLLGNMWFLWIFGKGLELRIGSIKLFLLYFLSAIGSGLVFSLAMPLTSVVIGASGAVSGILGSYIVLLPKSRIKTYIPPIFLVSIPAAAFILVWFLYQLLSISDFNIVVAYWAHIGGFLTGMLITNYIKRL